MVALALSACGTVDLGDNFVAPPVQLDEDFFYCEIQPNVLTEHSCAAGGSGESGMCHSARSALRLVDIDAPDLPLCDEEGRVLDPIPLDATNNLDAIRFTVQGSALSSPLYLRPINRASHPRRIFDENDPAAMLIIDWISQGGP
jgi:hypothetical protein